MTDIGACTSPSSPLLLLVSTLGLIMVRSSTLPSSFTEVTGAGVAALDVSVDLLRALKPTNQLTPTSAM